MTLLSLTREEAADRGALLAVDRYDIAVDLTGLLEGEILTSTSVVSFRCHHPGASTFVDCAADIRRATLNGVDLDVSAAASGRLPLRDLAADNVLVVEADTDNTATGEGILRTVDPTDGLVYVWTSFEPDEARRAWACFDQPDLKAPHRFTVTAPEAWVVTSNTGPEQVGDPAGGARVWSFPDTPRLSTYVVVVNAGPFHEVRAQHDGYDLGFFCRQALVAHLERDLDELVTLTRQGLAFFGEQFAMPFPQERYDQVFVPNLGGAMENWGCVTYGDSQLFRTPPSHAQRAVRAEFVMHEMAHMWFGDLVTMQWWDDLWLNEAFASWASNWALSRATEHTEAWSSFLTQFKRQAYDMDLGPGTHPIRSEVPDVDQAMANFDHITYLKGQSVLHQLMAYIGEKAFVAGLRAYFAEHAWGNTVLADLMSAFGAEAGRDLTGWTSAWLDRAGTDVLTLEGSTLSLVAPDGRAERPHRLDVAVFDTSGDTLHRTGVVETTLEGERVELDLPGGDLRLVNAGDLTFAAVRPDAGSRRAMFERIADLPDPLDRALVVATASQLLLLGEVAPRDAAGAVIRALPTESSPALVEPLLTMGLTYADRWAPPAEAPALLAAYADACAILAADPAHRQPALRSLARTASTDAHWELLEQAVAEATDHDLRWRMLARRAELGEGDPSEVDHLLETDPDPDAHVKRLFVLASTPTPEAKEEVWRAFFVDYSIPASRDTLLLGQTFWRPTQGELLQPYALRYLDELRSLKGGLLNQGVTIRAMYPLGVGDQAFLDASGHAAHDEAISKYARNQLRANDFVQSRILQVREL